VTPQLTCEIVATEDLIARYVSGIISTEELKRFEAHLVLCARCQEDVTLAASVGHQLNRAGSRGQRGGRFRRTLLAASLGGALTAAAALVVVLRPAGMEPGTLIEEHRSTDARSDTPIPISPIGDVIDGVKLHWRGSVSADQYRVTVVDGVGDLIWQAEVADTVAVLPRDVGLGPGVDYFWRVEARSGFNRWQASDFVEFRILDPN
jgi:hypothetical protein